MRVEISIYPDDSFTHPREVWVKDYIDFFIDDFPGQPHEGDTMWIQTMYNPSKLTEEEMCIIDKFCWIVDRIAWDKDDKGIYLRAICSRT